MQESTEMRETGTEQTLTKHDKARRLVEREVYACVSSLISDLTSLYWRAAQTPKIDIYRRKVELLPYDEEEIISLSRGIEYRDDDGTMIEPEVFEHWIVSDWLSVKLMDHDERMVNLSGLNIWCRTTAGQMIAADQVIEDIADDCY